MYVQARRGVHCRHVHTQLRHMCLHLCPHMCACAQIVYLEAGRVVEAGSHAELLRKGGKYAELWEQQASTIS